MHHFPAQPWSRRVALIWTIVLIAPACSVDVQDGVGPSVPVPNVTGQATRAGDAAEDLEVDLRRAEDAVVVDSTSTNGAGEFLFADVTLGEWEVKVSGDEESDFDSVSREFTLAHAGSLVVLPDLDVSAYGTVLLEPQDGSEMPTPNPFQPILFRWTLPDREVSWTRVRVYDAAGRPVWASEKGVREQAVWNGLGNEGDYDGRLVTAGDYSWRLKLGFPDDLEARVDYRGLVLR
jgi:hypothetical protein